MYDQSLMDEFFERIKILEEENKYLEKEYLDLDNQLIQKKMEQSVNEWLSPEEKKESEKRLNEYIQKVNDYKKIIDENFDFPVNVDQENINLPATLKNQNFDEKQLLDFFKLINDEKNRIAQERLINLDKIEKNINPKKEIDPKFDSLVSEFDKKFKGRILCRKNINYLIKFFDKKDKTIKVMLLYDSNGIKVNEKLHDKLKIYNSIGVNDLFENSYILSREKSGEIYKDYSRDNKHFIKIYYQIQYDKNKKYSMDKDLVPYKIEPNYIDINQYNLTIESNTIREVENKENRCFVMFDSFMIGEGKSTTGLVSSSSIKVYTTLYSKDILNILHIHINDTSQEITVDSVFLEKGENIVNHKVFTLDAMGNRLTYKFLFKDYKLIKVYYAVSNDFIDEPPFEEIRIAPNNYVKILKGEYKDYFGQVKQFPIGMLARKDKDLGELQKMSSSGFQKEGYCPDRHLEELPGFVSVQILFMSNYQPIKSPVKISLPVCFLIPLIPEEQIKFEKQVIIQQEMEIEEANQKIEEAYKKFQEYEKYIKNDAILEEKSLEEIKNIMADVEKIDIKEMEKNASEEFKDKLMFIQNIKEKLNPILIQKIRYLTLIGKK